MHARQPAMGTGVVALVRESRFALGLLGANLIRMVHWSVLAGAVLFSPTASRAALIGYWNFDETSGTTAHAGVGPVDGILQGNATFVPGAGISGGAVQITRGPSNDLVNFGDHFAFTSGDFSVVAWIKTAPNDTSAMLPLTRHIGGSDNGYFLAINNVGDAEAGGVNLAHFNVPPVTSGASSTIVNDGQWHQIVGTYSVGGASLSTRSLYIDGVLESSRGPLYSPIIGNTASFLLGGYTQAGAGTPTNYFAGLIDEVRVYDNALSAAEVHEAFLDPALSVPEPGSLSLFLPSALFLLRSKRRRKLAH